MILLRTTDHTVNESGNLAGLAVTTSQHEQTLFLEQIAVERHKIASALVNSKFQIQRFVP